MRQQHADGHWCGELLVDSTRSSDIVLYMHWAGLRWTGPLQEKCRARRSQAPALDGGWNIYYDGPSDVNASEKAYFALKLAGYSAGSR